MKRKIQQGIKAGIIIILVLAVGSACWFVYGRYQNRVSRERAIIQEGQTDETKNQIVPPKGEVTDDLRLHKYTFVNLTERMGKGDFIDIRISFSNGGDFILLSKKQIEEVSIGNGETGAENALWIYLTEEEILRMSSGVVDAYLNEGSKIYAIQYVSETQKESYMNYPVNDVVGQLIAENPNIITKAENVLEWSVWKEISGEGNRLGESNEQNIETPSLSSDDIFNTIKEEEITYFD